MAVLSAVTFTISALTTELLTDPASLGYASLVSAGDENTLFSLLNMPRVSGAYQQNRDPVTPDQIFTVIDPEEFVLVTATGLARLQTIFTLPVVDLGVSNVKTMLDGIFPVAGPTQQALAVLQKRDGSRAELLWGRGMIVTTNQIGQAI